MFFPTSICQVFYKKLDTTSPTKGISEYRRYPSLRMGSTVGSLAGNASAGCAWIRLSEPWDPTRRVFPLHSLRAVNGEALQ